VKHLVENDVDTMHEEIEHLVKFSFIGLYRLIRDDMDSLHKRIAG
jgi:hypothetical protein